MGYTCLIGLTVADTVEVYILAEGQESDKSGNETSNLVTIKVQSRGGQRDVLSIALAPDDSMG